MICGVQQPTYAINNMNHPINVITIVPLNSFDDTTKETMYQMYVTSYLKGNQQLFFHSKEQMFDVYNDRYAVSYNSNYLTIYAVVKNHKLSLICTNITSDNENNETKYLAMQLLNELITKRHCILEASDKVSWLLRKMFNTPIINNANLIMRLLNMNPNDGDTLTFNSDFNYFEKRTYQYTRTYKSSRSNKSYSVNKTLFGTADFSGIPEKCLEISGIPEN